MSAERETDAGQHNAFSSAQTADLRLGVLLALVQQGPAFVWEVDEAGMLLHLSPAARQTTGYLDTAQSPRHWTSFLHPDDQQRVDEAWREALTGGARLAVEARILCVVGDARWHALTLVPVNDDRGGPILWVGTARDIHDDKMREQELARMKTTLEALERCSEGLLYIKDREGCILWCNDGVVDVLGRERKDLLGRPATEYMRRPQDADHVSEHDRHVVNEGRTLMVEEILHSPHRVYLSAKAPWRAADGAVMGLVGVSLNVTDEHRLRSQWRPEFERFEGATPIIVSRFDAHLRHVTVNKAIETITGLPQTAFIGKTNRELGMPAHLCDEWDAVMRAVLADGRPREIEFTYAAPNAKARVFRSLISLDSDTRGERAALVAVAHDVTELKAQQALIREREARLSAALSVAKLHTWTYLVGEDLFLVPANTRKQHAIGGNSERVRWVDAFSGIHQEDVERVQRSLRQCSHGQADYDETYRVRDAEGNWRWVRAAGRYVPYDPADGSAPHIAGVTFDLTDERRALQMLRESEESLRLAVDAVRAGRYDWDLITGELKWDARTRELFHLPADQSPSFEFFLSTLHPEDRVRLAARVGVQLDGAQSDGLWSERYRVVQPDGSLRWLESQGRVAFDETGGRRRAVRFIGLVTDVTERVEMLERLSASEVALRNSLGALAESEERMRLAMDSSSLGWWDMDVETTSIVWSASSRRLFDMPEAGDVQLEQALERIVEGDVPRIRQAIEAAMAPSADGTFHESYRVQWRDGSLHEVEAIGRVRFERRNGIRTATRFSGVLWDVTQERATWRALQDKRAHLAALVQTVPVGILSVNKDGVVTRSNPFMDELFGRASRGRDVSDAARQWESYRSDGLRLDAHAYPLMQVLDGADRSESEVLHVCANDGRRRWLRLIAAPVAQQGQLAGAVMVSLDIDAERRAVEVLRQTDLRKEQFFAMLAHEIRNPLAAISNATHILARDAGLSERSAFATGIIRRQGAQLQSLVDDLLEVSRISRDSFTLDKVSVSVSQLIQEAGDAALLQAQGRGQSLTVVLPAHEVRAEVDAVRFAQVLDNLIGNAIKYTPEGGMIQLALCADATHFEVAITDNGIGIDAEELDSVFELFHQQKRQSGQPALGFGIGLAMVKRLVELHQGTVWAESEGPGRGARFVVRIPRVAAVSSRPPEFDTPT